MEPSPVALGVLLQSLHSKVVLNGPCHRGGEEDFTALVPEGVVVGVYRKQHRY